MMGWSTSGPQLNLDNWTRHRNRGWGLGERGVGEDTVFVLDTLSYTSIVFHKFFKLKINIKETHYYSDASHVPRAWAGSESYHSPPPFFIILSLYTISSQPDDDLHSPWDPFHQDVNRGLPPNLKTTNSNLIWSFCLLFPFSTELQKRVVGPHFLHFFISHYSLTLSIQAFVFITSSLKTDVFLALYLVS